MMGTNMASILRGKGGGRVFAPLGCSRQRWLLTFIGGESPVHCMCERLRKYLLVIGLFLLISSIFLCVCAQGDCSKAKKELGWVPEITFKELVNDMMKSDIANVDAGNDHA